ncbi:hypothetical protein CHUAL_014097 [Chamberlinius hualienensis]
MEGDVEDKTSAIKPQLYQTEKSPEAANDMKNKRKGDDESSKESQSLQKEKCSETLSECQQEDEDENIEDDDLKYCPKDANSAILNVIKECNDEKLPTENVKDEIKAEEIEKKSISIIEEEIKVELKDGEVSEKSESDQVKEMIDVKVDRLQEGNTIGASSSIKVSDDKLSSVFKKSENTLDEFDKDLISENENCDTADSDISNCIQAKLVDKNKDEDVIKVIATETKEIANETKDSEGDDTGLMDTKESDDLKKELESEKNLENDTSIAEPIDIEEKELDMDRIAGDDALSDSETPTLAILDVRTVFEDEPICELEEKDTKQVDSKKDDNENSEEEAIAASELQSDKSDCNNEKDKDKESEIEDAIEVVTTVMEDSETEKKDSPNADKETSGKKQLGRVCLLCGKLKPCKFKVIMLGTTRYLCDDICFKTFRDKKTVPIKTITSTESISENRPITRSLTKDVCNVCHKDIKNGMGLLPGIGENKPLCSEECMKSYQADQGLKRACAQCGKHIQSRSKCLTWEAMEFCNELCLGNYQIYLGSHCAFCNKAVQQTYIGKYCVRFGLDIKQFCSNGCLEEFKQGLKVCSYCQKDISVGPEGFLAPVGDKGQFKEFCSQTCMEKFELMGNANTQPSFKKCSMCKKLSSVNVEVTFEGKEHKLCSESCVAAFRYVNKINTSICDTCHKFFDLDVTKQMTIQFEGSSKRFCSKACMNVFVLYHRKVVPCSWCRVKKYNFDMIERVDSNNHVQLFCSLNCLSLFRVSLNATSSRRVQCDYCRQVKPAQFHLTMSDASIRNFCTLNCAMHFQGQFTVAPVISTATGTTSDSTGVNSTAGNSKATAVIAAGTPIISSVVSLAPSTQQTTLPTSTQPKAVFVMSAPGTGSTASNVTFAKPVQKASASTQTSAITVAQQVVLKPPVAKSVKNKAVNTRPVMQTKGVSCKPHPCHKNVQTDDIRTDPVIIPFPVPIYVPVPVRMFTTPTPVPLPIPIPIPIPIFIPTTKNSASGIFKQIKEIQQTIPDNPIEADLILMAEMVAADSSSKDKQQNSKPKEIKQNDQPQIEVGENYDIETATQPEVCQPSNFGDDVIQMALRIAEEHVDLEAALSTSNTLSHSQPAEENGDGECMNERQVRSATKSKRSSNRGRGRGRKRVKLEEPSENVIASPTGLPSLAASYGLHTVLTPQIETNCVLKYSYGVNAWKHWVLQKNNQLEKASATNRKLKLFKTDILQLTADELNYSLCLFVKEVRKPNSEEYAPDSIYYLCLGIQQYLFENGRIDNIFSDAYYEKFTECLNEVLQRYEINLTHDGKCLW